VKIERIYVGEPSPRTEPRPYRPRKDGRIARIDKGERSSGLRRRSHQKCPVAGACRVTDLVHTNERRLCDQVACCGRESGYGQREFRASPPPCERTTIFLAVHEVPLELQAFGRTVDAGQERLNRFKRELFSPSSFFVKQLFAVRREILRPAGRSRFCTIGCR